MSWAKLSDDFADDCWGLSDQAHRLHVDALCWNGRKLLDCMIPKADLRRFAKHEHAAAELVALEFWADRGDCYEIIHHAQYQRKRADVLKQQAANRANGRKGGRPKKEAPPRERFGDKRPIPAPDPVQSESESESLTERDWTGQALKGEVHTQDESRTQADSPADGYAWAESEAEADDLVARFEL